MKTTLYLVRHAQAQGNLLKEFNGVTDGDVTYMGYLQLDRLTKKSETFNVEAIYSSPLKRAYLTAQAINKNFNLPVHVHNGLIEIDCGDWEDELWETIKNKYKESYNLWEKSPRDFIAPNGESMKDTFERFNSAISSIVENNKGKTIVITSHAAAIRCYLAHVLNLGIDRLTDVGWGDNTHISKICYDDNLVACVEYKYDNSHLDDDTSTIAMRKRMFLK